MGQAIVNINKKQYTGADVSFDLFGYREDEVKEASYDYERKHNYNESLKGISSYSVGGITNMKFSLTLYMTAVHRIEKLAKNSGQPDITLLKPFKVAINYLNDDLEEKTDIVTAKFQSMGRTITGEGGLAQQFEMFVTGIALNV